MVRTTPKPMSDETFERLALDDPDGQWELWHGVPRRKPGMTFWHGEVTEELAHRLWVQLDRSQFRVRSNKGRVRRPGESYFIPDVFVIPVSAFGPLRDRNDENELEVYPQPMPLVIEALSRSTRRYDQRTKLEEYKRRGDQEIWLLDPRTRTLTMWRIQPDGSYTESVQQGGTVQPAFLPNVTIDLDTLFE